MKKPFEGHPYRGGESTSEKIERLKRDFAHSLTHILEAIKKSDGINSLSKEELELGDALWAYMRIRDVGASVPDLRIKFDAVAFTKRLNVPIETAKFLGKFSLEDLQEFEERWIPDR